MPRALISETDWLLFQEDLNRSDLVILGRASYVKFSENKRNRLIPTNQINGYEKGDDICFFNPNDIPINEILLKGKGGTIYRDSHELKKLIEKFIDDPKIFLKKSIIAKKNSSHFNLKNHVDRFEKILVGI